MAEKYRPSNGTEGDCFMAKWCEQCVFANFHDEDEPPCDIMGNALFFDIDDEEYPAEWTYNDKKEPICTAFRYEMPEENYRCPDTKDLFNQEEKT